MENKGNYMVAKEKETLLDLLDVQKTGTPELETGPDDSCQPKRKGIIATITITAVSITVNIITYVVFKLHAAPTWENVSWGTDGSGLMFCMGEVLFLLLAVLIVSVCFSETENQRITMLVIGVISIMMTFYPADIAPNKYDVAISQYSVNDIACIYQNGSGDTRPANYTVDFKTENKNGKEVIAEINAQDLGYNTIEIDRNI